jgi:hypothetical protein
MYFNEALRHFDEQSIDLVHIDGLHTYEAVCEDFEGWFPKVRPGGVMLFHDVAARIKDFGVWLFWDEIYREHESFTFNHGFGLGVLRKGGGESQSHPLLRALFESDEEERERLRAFYVHAAEFLIYRRQARAAAERARKAKANEGPTDAQPS